MTWPKVSLKYQRYESFHNSFGARKIVCWPEGKKNRKEETNKQTKKRKAILNCFVYQN